MHEQYNIGNYVHATVNVMNPGPSTTQTGFNEILMATAGT